MSPNELAESWYPGNFMIEKLFFEEDNSYGPNSLAGDVLKILRETDKVKADKFYKRIYQPFD